MKRLIFCTFFLINLIGATFGQNSEQFSRLSANKSFFIENKGQWNKDILFLAEANGMHVWITTTDIVFVFYTVQGSPLSPNSLTQNPNERVDSPIIKGNVVKMKIGVTDQKSFANQEINTGTALEQYNNYFIGNDQSRWASHVKLFSSVLIKNYVPNVDLNLYYDEGKFRYDLVAHAGLNPNNIVLKFEGQDSLQFKDFQTLLIKTSIGDVSHGDLKSYQTIDEEKRAINSEFSKKSESSIGFQVKTFDPSYPVIIDPLLFSTYLGGSSIEYGYDVDIDASGYAIIGGITSSPNFPTTSGAFQLSAPGGYDLFVSKFNSIASSLTFSTYIGGWSTDYLNALKVDANGNCYITGYTSTGNYPVTTGAYDVSFNGGSFDAFVTKLNATGTALIYSTYIGGTNLDYATNIDVDASNNAYICGYTMSNTYPTSSGAFQTAFQAGTYDGFVTKINPLGTALVYSTFLGGSSADYCNGIDADAGGFAYITGYTQSANFPRSAGCFQSVLSGGQDAFVTKLNVAGSSLSYSTLLGGNNMDKGSAVAVDGSGLAAVTGSTYSTNFATISGAYQTASSGSGDGFVSKINSAGTALINSTLIGGNSTEEPNRIAIDKNSNILISGYTGSTNFPSSFCAYQTSSAGSYDIFVTAFNPTLSSLLYSSCIGGNSIDYGYGLAVNSNSEVYASGYTYSTNFPTSSSALQKTMSMYDAVLFKFQYLALTMSGTVNNSYCAGSSFSMSFVTGCIFTAGNAFRIQLSNASGSFAAPVTLGTVTRSTSGTVNCFIPKNTPYGTGYRIRLISSNPVYTTNDNGFNIRIKPSPISQFSINNVSQCLNNNNFVFTNSSSISSGSYSNLWKFGDKATSNLTNSSHSYALDSSYSVKLVCISDSGCRDSISKPITVLSSPNTDFTVNDSIQCSENNFFDFNSLTNIRKGSFSILWKFGDGDTSSSKSPTHSFISSSIFKVYLTAISNNGCKDSTLKTVRVDPSPSSTFMVNDTSQCLINNNFAFLNFSTISKGSLTHLWNFGDGNTSTAVNPIYVYSNPNKYKVVLVSTSDSGCVDSMSAYVYIISLPVAQFKVNNSSQCLQGNSFAFTNQSNTTKGNMVYLWNFGDGITDTSTNSVHSFLSDSTFTVKLIAYSSMECMDTAKMVVFVHPSPKSSFVVNDSDQCLNENNFVFTNTSTIKSDSLTHLWQLGDATTINTPNASHRYSVDKAFQVKLISTSNLGCKDSTLKSVLVNPSPVSNFFVFDTGMCFKKNLFSFANNTKINSGKLHYRWEYADSKTDTIRNTTHAFATFGNYNVKLIATSYKNCSDSFSRMIYVYPMPVASFSVNDSIQCLKGNNFDFFNSSSIPSGSNTYNWKFGDGAKSQLTDPSHSYSIAKMYFVMLSVGSDKGCLDSITKQMLVNVMPKADFSFGTICLDESINFTNKSVINKPDSITQYLWDFGDGSTSAIQSPTYTYLTSGSFIGQLTVVSNSGCRDSISKPVYLRPHISAPVLNKVSVRYETTDIEISWSIPTVGHVNAYVLEKSSDNITFKTLTNPDKFTDHYIDASVLPPFTKSYYYRIKAIDSCNYFSPYSNLGKSILLEATNFKHIGEIKWSAYELWPEGINRYDIEVFNDKISDFVVIGFVDKDSLQYNDDVTALNQSQYCYRVVAVRNGDEMKAYSNSDCVSINFGCYIPNSFTPNADGLNDQLLAYGASVFKFNLAIFNRWGTKIFETNDMKIGWDGTYMGKELAEGYYYFQMSARGVKNNKVTKKGTILLSRPKL